MDDLTKSTKNFPNTLGRFEFAWAGWCRQERGDGLRDLTLLGFLPWALGSVGVKGQFLPGGRPLEL